MRDKFAACWAEVGPFVFILGIIALLVGTFAGALHYEVRRNASACMSIGEVLEQETRFAGKTCFVRHGDSWWVVKQ